MATNLNNAGNTVVPLAAILDQLKDKLSSAEIDALLFAIVARKKTEVRPGDLITADLFNQILADLADLNLRVAQLEAGAGGASPGQVVVFEPAAGANLRVGELIQIVGLNFGFSAAQQRVTFDELPVSGFAAGSGDNLLRVMVPALPNIGQGRAAVLSVGNGSSTVTRAVTVLPPDQPLTGTVDVQAGISDPSPIVANQNADFPFTLNPRGLNRTAEFQLTATLAGQSWSDRLRLLGPAKTLLPGGKITLTPNERATVFVRIEPVPANSNGQSFSLALSLNAGPVNGSSPISTHVVNQPPEPRDDTIKPTIGNVSPAGTMVGGEIRLAGGGFASIPVDLQSTQAGGPFEYDLTLALLPETTGGALATGWSFGFLQPATQPPSLPKATLRTTGNNGSMLFAIAAATNASATGKLRLSMQRKGTALAQFLDLNLRRT